MPAWLMTAMQPFPARWQVFLAQGRILAGALFSAILLVVIALGLAEAQPAASTSTWPIAATTLLGPNCLHHACGDARHHHHCTSFFCRMATSANAGSELRKHAPNLERGSYHLLPPAPADTAAKAITDTLRGRSQRGAPYWATFASTQRMLN